MTLLLRTLVLIAYLSVIVMNFLAARGSIGGVSPAYVSEKYPTLLTPAGYAFSIWGLIYLGVGVFTAYQLFLGDELDRIRRWFLVTCIGNVAWIFCWHYEYLGLSVLAMLLILFALAMINVVGLEFNQTRETLVIRVPFSVYFGWVSIASVLNISIYLISLGIVADPTFSTIIAAILLVGLTAFSLFLRELLNIPLYSLTLAWAITAIAVKQTGQTAIIVVSALCVVALLISTLTFVLRDEKFAAK